MKCSCFRCPIEQGCLWSVWIAKIQNTNITCLDQSFQILTLLKYIENFSSLTESKIEGLEPYVAKFNQIFASIKKKPYDVLDQRKLDFDQDFDDFKRQLTDLEVMLPYNKGLSHINHVPLLF